MWVRMYSIIVCLFIIFGQINDHSGIYLVGHKIKAHKQLFRPRICHSTYCENMHAFDPQGTLSQLGELY